MKKYRLDLMVISAVIIAGAVMLILISALKKPGKLLQIKVDGRIVKELDLNVDIVFEIEGAEEGKNTLVIKNGRAGIEKATCPDGLCIGMGEIYLEGQSIVCLPNKVIVQIIGDSGASEVDIRAG